MFLVAYFCQLHLLLPLGKAGALIGGLIVIATWTGNPLHILWRKFIVFGNGVAAAVALIVAAFVQVVIYRYTVIKYKTLALP